MAVVSDNLTHAPPPHHRCRDTLGEVLFCRLLCILVGPRKVQLHSSAANITLAALRRWGDSGGTGTLLGSGALADSGGGADLLQHEALQALGSMVQDNFVQVGI